MRFKTRMVFMYAILMVIIALVLGLFFYRYSVQQYQKAEAKNLEVAVDQLVVQLDEKLSTMELTMNYILSDPTVLSSIRMLAQLKHPTETNRYLLEAKTNIRTRINTDFIQKNFYRTLVFNKTGSVVSTQTGSDGAVHLDFNTEAMPWLTQVDEEKGKPVIVNTHVDPWGVAENDVVFSLIKAVQGNNMGYIEVQRRLDTLKDTLVVSKDGLMYMIFVNGNELLYTNYQGNDIAQYQRLAQEEGNFVKQFFGEGQVKQLIAKNQSDTYIYCILLIENQIVIDRESDYIKTMTFGIVGTFFIISMILVFVLSQFLTRPIRQLRGIMESTKIENMGEAVFLETSNDEIESLRMSYQNVLGRLQKSIIKEKRTSFLHVQAQYDSLQAQVNPHFIFNVLNVITARGMAIEDETICNMCGSLAKMLRYSTNNKNRYATIEEELEYLKQYFYLLKTRYEHKIEFVMNVSSAIEKQWVPKVGFQQIVENSINHGFENATKLMKIHIDGWEMEGFWSIRIQDNGKGFDNETLESLKKKLEMTKTLLLNEDQAMELEIGGMGLVNTYARLFILYGEELIFDIRNGEDGAEVTIGAPMGLEL